MKNPSASAAESSIEESFKSCRSLADPVGFWCRLIPFLLVFQVAVMLVIASFQLINSPSSEIDPSRLKIFLVVLFLVFISFWFVLRPFLIIGRKPKVLFLRAFSHDRKADRDRFLREAIRECLPSSLALGGIRPPDTRVHSWFRSLGEGLVAMRYLGSNNFELEAADRNWFARLLASASRARGVIVDLRETTPFVHEEIKLVACLNGGPEKTFLIGDDSRSEDDWYREFKEASGFQGDVSSIAKLVMVPCEPEGLSSTAFRNKLAEIFSSLKNEPMGVTEPAFQLAQDKVAIEDWETPWHESSFAQFLKAYVPLAMISFFLPPAFSLALALIATSIFLVLTVYTLLRLVKTARRQKLAGIRPKPGFLSLALTLSPVALIAFLASLSIAAVDKAEDNAVDARAQVEVSAMETAFESYYQDYSMLPMGFPAVFASDSEKGDEFLAMLGGSPGQSESNPRGTSFLSRDQLSSFADGYSRLGFIDPYGNSYHIAFNNEYLEAFEFSVGAANFKSRGQIAIVSGGPDGEVGTSDDVLSSQIEQK